MLPKLHAALLAAILAAGCQGTSGGTLWHVDNLRAIGGHPVSVQGDPGVIATPAGRALEFDGVDDAVFLDTHPLAGLTEFTVEVEFRPYAGGASEQRFFHMQEHGSENRVMFETRLVGDDQWFLDTYIRSGEEDVTLYAEDDLHPIGPWYHAAIVVSGDRFEHYVNGLLELGDDLGFMAPGAGRTSLGTRINRVHWFKGAIRKVRVTPRALEPEDFMPAGGD